MTTHKAFMASLPKKRRMAIRARAAELLAEEMTLQELRKALDRSQEATAKAVGLRQAADNAKKPSSISYGKMSGTSMASPYCAAAHILFRLVRPGYTGTEIVQCLVSSGVPNGDGVPMVRLTKALNACPARG